MGKSRLFDNIMQVIATTNVIAGTTVDSNEIDLELPRGYVAKIHKVIVQIFKWDAVLGAAENDRFSWAVLLDPDDATTVEMPDNSVEHDVLVSGFWSALSITTLALSDVVEKQYDFSHLEGLDILSARNMRFNTVAAGTDLNATELKVFIYYTLEEIKDAQIMELLDIL